MTEVKEYVDPNNHSPFGAWFNDVDATVAAKVTRARQKLAAGHSGNTKSVGEGVFEYKIDFGPGYRLYYGKDGNDLILLLSGGSKKTQQQDIAEAKRLWKEYKVRKRKAEKEEAANTKERTKDGTHKRLQGDRKSKSG